MGCHICEGLEGPADTFVYEDAHWAAYQAASVPGWTMLATKEHVEGTWGLTPQQAEGLGPIARELSAAVKQASGAERVYMMYLGETAPHFHALLLPIAPGEPALMDNARLLEAAERDADDEAARAMREAIRGARGDAA